MIEAVIFDIDGTLIDSVEGHAQAWDAALREFGFTPDLQAVRRQIGKGADQLLPSFLKPDEIKQVGAAIDDRQSEIFKARHLADVEAFPRVRDLFDQLRRDGVKCVLGSSGKAADVEQAETIADITGLVDAMATSEDVDRSKPSPDIVQVALEKIAPIPASRCVFVGDTPWDAQAARRAGVIALGIASPVFRDDELRAAGCQQVVNSIEDLRQAYEQLLNSV
ncbi:MAG: HAD family hydrolase [Caulobacteraceae bacterium]|nr:HAD family hydrolase [Caulobacteraceae bacterium]